MRKHTGILVISAVLAAGTVTASAFYPDDSHGSSSPMMGNGMLDRGGMMGRDGMMGSMMQMMENCGQMMQGMKDGSRRPNDQWKKTLSAPGEKI